MRLTQPHYSTAENGGGRVSLEEIRKYIFRCEAVRIMQPSLKGLLFSMDCICTSVRTLPRAELNNYFCSRSVCNRL